MCLFVGNCNAGTYDVLHGKSFQCFYKGSKYVVEFYNYASNQKKQEGLMFLIVSGLEENKEVSTEFIYKYWVVDNIIKFNVDGKEESWFTDGVKFVKIIPEVTYTNTIYGGK